MSKIVSVAETISKVISLREALEIPDGPALISATRAAVEPYDIDLLRRHFEDVGRWVLDLPGSWVRQCSGGLIVCWLNFDEQVAYCTCPKNGCAECGKFCTVGALMTATFLKKLDDWNMLLGKDEALP